MVQYDPTVIVKFAEGLYKKARQIIASYTLLGVLVGAALGFVLPMIGGNKGPTIEMWSKILAALGALLFGTMAYSAALAKVFHLKLTAQTALCQMMIEANTRPRGMAAPHTGFSQAAV